MKLPKPKEGEEEMKIVTYNVNGLRQRVAQYGSLLNLLTSLDADILCFQETKLSKQDLSVDLTFAEGYEAFLSCTRATARGRSAYSGVATFCRVKSAFGSDEVALPVAAEEGFTGLCPGSGKKEMVVGNFEVELPLMFEGLEGVTKEDLLKVDGEGRCVITDHGHFVLFNLYGPRADEDDKERLQFKLVFFKVLQKRWEALLSQGRRVIVVGDLNIAPAAIDRCDAEPGFEKNMFRKWLRSLLKDSGGPFFDVFRSKHPERKEAYTCFSPRVGAEEFNYGSRIDHILIGGPCLHEEHDLDGHNFLNCHAEGCDIMIQFKRGKLESTPKWQGGRTTKLDGSDHVPVYAVFSNIPNLLVHSTPPLAVRYIPEVRGWQQTIVSFLTKKENNASTELPGMANFVSNENTEVEDKGKSVESSPNFKENKNMRLQKHQSQQQFCSSVVKKARHSTYSQLTLKKFFQQLHTRADYVAENENMSPEKDHACDENVEENIEESSSELNVPTTNPCSQNSDNSDLCFSSQREKGNVAVLEWQRIQEKMRTSIPLCKGHREPCVARSVKKGPNVGRRFYVCARAKGPESEPQANCNYFQWASVKSKQKGI